MKWDAFCDFSPFVKLKKREKHPWSSVTFSKEKHHMEQNILG